MRQNKNISIAFDISREEDKETLDYLIAIASTTNRSLSQVAKTLLEFGIITFDAIIKGAKKDEK